MKVILMDAQYRRIEKDNFNKYRGQFFMDFFCISVIGHCTFCVIFRLVVPLKSEAERLYDLHHDEVVDYRQTDLYEEKKVSIKSKSIGLALRLSGAICLLRNYCEWDKEKKSLADEIVAESDDDQLISGQIPEENEVNEEEEEIRYDITGEDFKMALGLTKYSVKTSIALLSAEVPGMCKSTKQRVPKNTIKTPIPEPENCSMEYLLLESRHAKKYLSTSNVSMTDAIRNKWYPSDDSIDKMSLPAGSGLGRVKGMKFVRGLQELGLGVLSPGKNHFKRIHYDDEDCDDKENLKKKYRMLNL